MKREVLPIYRIDFNINQIGQSILEWLQASVHGSFKFDTEAIIEDDELFHFCAEFSPRIVSITALKNGRLGVFLEREDKETFYSLIADDSKKDQEGVTGFQLATVTHELVIFLSSGSFERSEFDCCTGGKVDADW